MSKFKVGDKVRVTVNNPENSRVAMDDVLTISECLGTDSVGENYQVNGRWYIHGKYLKAVTLPTKEITLNGATTSSRKFQSQSMSGSLGILQHIRIMGLFLYFPV